MSSINNEETNSSPINSLLTNSTIENNKDDISAIDNPIGSLSAVQPTGIDNDDSSLIFSVKKIYKNLFVQSFALVLLFTAYINIGVLQSSLNTEHNIGVNSLITSSACIIFSAIFLTSSFLDIFGLKWSIIVPEVAHVLYILANIRPLPSFMYISAVMDGLVSTLLWTAQASYINRIAYYHALHKHQATEVSVRLFFGLFYALYGTSQIWGNLISYFVLNQSSEAQHTNCGIHFDPHSAVHINTTNDVNETTRYVLCGIFAGMGILSVILLSLLLDQIRLSERQTLGQSMKKSMELLASLAQCKHIEQIFLIPITIWTQIEYSFLSAQFTRAFITCFLGIRYIGLVMVCYGICYVPSSYLFGWLAKYIGRIGCFLTAALLNYAMIILMYFWEFDNNQMVILFAIAGVWAIADVIWQSQMIATYTILYAESDRTAITRYRLWKAVGSLISFSYASYISIRFTLFLLLIFLTISMVSYGIAEGLLRRKDCRKKPTT